MCFPDLELLSIQLPTERQKFHHISIYTYMTLNFNKTQYEQVVFFSYSSKVHQFTRPV